MSSVKNAINTLFGEKNKEGQSRKVAKTTYDSIPFEYVYDDGIIETEPGTFTRAYHLGDISFQTASDTEALKIFRGFSSLLDKISDVKKCQVVIINKRISSKLEQMDKFMYRPENPAYNEYSQQLNEIIGEKMITGRHGLEQKKYIVISTDSKDTLKAQETLRRMDKPIRDAVKRISNNLDPDPLTSEERLRSIFDIYNQDREGVFDNTKDDKGKPAFSFEKMALQGMTPRKVVAPSGMFFDRNKFVIGNTYGRSFFLEKIPDELSTDFLQELADLDFSNIISINYEAIPQGDAIRRQKSRLTAIEADISKSQKAAAQNGYSAALIPQNLRVAREGVLELIDDLTAHKQKAYDVTLCVTIFAESEEQLENYTKRISVITTPHLAPLKTLHFQQEDGLNSCLPLCLNKVECKHLCTTESASVFLPFTSIEINDEQGLYYGMNETTRNLILYNRKSNKNYNGFYFGESGSGKSAAVKLEILQALMRSKKNKVYVIDPDHEYCDIAAAVGPTVSEVISLAPDTATYINPFDMDVNYGGDEGPLAMKSDFILGLIEIMQNNRPLEPIEKSIIDRCVRNIYRGYLEHMQAKYNRNKEITISRDDEALPTLKDLLLELTNQHDPIADNLATSIEIYANGSLQTFAHRSNVDSDKQLVVYDIYRLGTVTKNLALHICLNDIWNKMIQNKILRDENTWIVCDEFHILLSSPSAVKFVNQFWKRCRKFGGISTGIIQNCMSLLLNPEARDLLGNTGFIMAHSLARPDREALGEFLNLSEVEKYKITDAPTGHGLFIANGMVIPFNNVIDTEKYPELGKLIDTTSNKREGFKQYAF